MLSNHSEVNKNLAKLILWADKVVLHGMSETGDSGGKDSAKGITEAVKKSVDKLVVEYIDKLKEKEQRLSISPGDDHKSKRSSLPVPR